MTRKTKNSATPISRRDFLKFCTTVAVALGLHPLASGEVAKALLSSTRPPVIWLHFSECTGCTEAILRGTSPFFAELIMNVISLEYHETLMAASGAGVEEILSNAAEQYNGEFFAIVEGSIPTANNGVFGMIGGRTMLSIAQEILPKAKGIIACGTCSAYGGLAAAAPNPTGARGVKEALPGLLPPVINVPGCPPNPVTLVAVIADYLLNGSFPALDSLGRPFFAYGKKIHAQCPFRAGSQRSRCVRDEGCKGQWSYNNCPTIGFNDDTSFPMKAGHPCIGCSEPSFWDTKTPFYKSPV